MKNIFNPPGKRPNSIALMGGAFGDEGKGRVVDEFVHLFLQSHKQVIQYRDNGGSNAGHTVEVGTTRISLHQIGSGILQKGCIVISGKDMVIHPQDLVSELMAVKKISGGQLPATYILDEMAVLCLDTHRAMENLLKAKTTGGARTATGRGISPAYADVINRFPLRARDLIKSNWHDLFTAHYQLNRDLIKGLGASIAQVEIPTLDSTQTVGTLSMFLSRLEKCRRYLHPYIKPVFNLLNQAWSKSTPFIFEKAQALGLDYRFGTYPDVTVSDCSYQGILSSTEGIVDPHDIAAKAAVIKTTYMSSVGSHLVPSKNHHLTDRIRDDAHEYGATTGRPRNIHYLDIPFLSFIRRVGGYQYLCPTHLDISYPDEPITVCMSYVDSEGRKAPYRPDQDYLLTLKPVFKTFESWDGVLTRKAKKPDDLPPACHRYLTFLSKTLDAKLLLATTGPKRHQTIKWF